MPRMNRATRALATTRLRAGVMGAGDGIVSVAGMVTGIAATDAARAGVLSAGIVATVAGAVSMAASEYVSVAAQADAERGQVARGELWADQIARPWTAASTSAQAFVLGAVWPLLAVILAPTAWRVAAIAVAVLAALTVTGTAAARLAGTAVTRSTLRTLAGGVAALAVTYLLGRLTGLSGL